MLEKISVEKIRLEQLESSTNPLQSEQWANLKVKNGWTPYPFRIRIAKRETTLLVLVKRLIFNYSIAYIPYGPPEGFYHDELSNKLRLYLPKGVVFLRYDLPFGNTQKPNKVRILKESVQPEGSVILDLSGGYGEVTSHYRQRARRHLKRGPLKIIKYGGEEKNFERWYQLYRETAHREGFSPRSSSYIYQFLNSGGELYCAYHKSEMVGGIVIFLSYPHALYLFGTSKVVAKISPAYRLQDYVIGELCARDFKSYDLHGISGDEGRGSHLAGLDQFKLSFGGEKVTRHPSFDFPYRKVPYLIYAPLERWRMKLHRQTTQDS